jgi:hypothetical protein
VEKGHDAKTRPLKTLVIDWDAAAPETTQKKEGDGWGKTDGMDTLRRCLMSVNFQEEGTEIRPWPDGPPVRAVKCDSIEAEFRKLYVARSHTAEAADEAKRKAFDRALKAAQKRNLVGYCTIDGTDWVWLGTSQQSSQGPARR